ncbi:helix-turn-helix transcriptional regulator [Sphingobium estronivorans]|uniref:helix-turn-helix transcriptional regulator n=1 Tax=Sphingobium estronivorans TaxID=1577690 RepID=UPI001239A769|nr:helix-turn-helix domain-containing protein [Sphingobium estronivorans]
MTPYSEAISHGPRFITLSQFCQRYQVSRSTVYRLAHQGGFSIVKFGRSSRIALDEVEAWAQSLPVMGEER